MAEAVLCRPVGKVQVLVVVEQAEQAGLQVVQAELAEQV
jgi:hypothetical protein